MSDIDTSGGGSHKKGKKKGRKKSNNRIDFTPMVDLGFLLITFFMLTTSMTKPKTMEIQKPKNEKIPKDQQTKLNAAQALTILLTKNNKIVYYNGMLNDPTVKIDPKVIGYGPDEFRSLLNKENRERNPKADSIVFYKKQAEHGTITVEDYRAAEKRIFDEVKATALFVLIKTDDQATYKNLVDALDEMSITNIRSYAIVDITPQEELMAKTFVK